MASFVVIYRAGPDPIPEERFAENRAAWRAWNETLGEAYGIRTAGGRVVSRDRAVDAGGVIRGAPMVDFESMDAAVEVARNAPNVAFGGTVQVLQE